MTTPYQISQRQARRTGVPGASELQVKLETKQAIVAVVGLGLVGHTQAVALTKAGFRVLGLDADSQRIEALAGRRNGHSAEPQIWRLTTNYAELVDADCVIVCAPTGHYRDGTPELSALQSAARSLAPHVREGMLVVLESTVPPGTTQGILQHEIEAQGLRAGEDFHLAFSPERVDPGSSYPLEKIPKVVGGVTQESTETACAMYRHISDEVVPVSSPQVAEMAKVFENTFRYVNIGLANELAMLCSAMGLNVQEVIAACSTKPFAFMAHKPGAGVGGRCIPMAPRYFAWAAQEAQAELPITDAAMVVNDEMPRHVATRAVELIARHHGNGAQPTVLLLGMSYKPNLDDPRGSVAPLVAAELLRLGMRVVYHDPHVQTVTIDGRTFTSQALDSALIEDADCAILLCPHDAVDYDLVLRHARIMLDPTGRFQADGERIFWM
jgi:UDP-N-acetyl-D-glucosamine dehydrogenase